MLTSSKNFRTSLSAAILAIVTLSPAIPAQAVETQVKAKAPVALQVASAQSYAGTSNIDDLAAHVLDIRTAHIFNIRSSPLSAPILLSVATVKQTAADKCFENCLHGFTDLKWWNVCAYTCY